MDPQNYDSSVASDLNSEKQNILRQLNDMFYAIPLERIRDICDQCLWNVDLCIDKLISFKGDKDREQPQGQQTTLNPNAPSFSNILQSVTTVLPSGAVPKGNAYGSAVQVKPSTHGLPAVYAHVYDNINNGFKVLILMRGAPGSGKSYLAKSMAKKLMPGRDWKDFVLSADDYFYDSLGRYRYNVERLDDAHKYCQSRAREKTTLGWSPVIIDNTNMKLWELLPYVQVAVQNGYMVELMEPATSWRNSAGRLAAKNTHNVQKQKIQRMLDNYEVATTRDVLMLLKETKYTVSLPQFRKYPPPPIISAPAPPPQAPQAPIAAPLPLQCSTNPRIAMETESSQPIEEQVMQIVRAPSNSSVTFVDTTSSWLNYDTTAEVKQSPIPKSPRKKREQQQQHRKPDQNFGEEEASNQWCFPLTPSRSKTFDDDQATQAQLFPTPPTVWQAYEQEATKFWGVPITSSPSFSKPPEPMSTDQNDGCGLLQLLKEGVKSINVPSKGKSPANELEYPANDFKRHRVGCENENSSFIGLRQIYPNKPTTELWDLFVKCNGSIDWAVDILLKDETAGYDNDSDSIENRDNYNCGCDNPMSEPAPLPPVTVPNTEINAKPQRPKPPRNRVRTAELQEVKEAVEKSFVLGDEHYSSHVKKIRNKRHTIEDTSVPDQRKTFIDIQVQTDGDDNDNISEEGTDGSEILEIDLGEDLIGQLSMIFKAEAPAPATLEKYKTNVFMPKSLAREIYLLWMESMYNQMEEQRQSLLKEDEDFARLLKNPKYENCKQPPENIKELLDMEFAWMVYKTEQEEYRASANQHMPPNDLASHLTRMKLCEIFPNIPKETLYDILAAHNNKFSDTVEVLQSTIQPAIINHQATAKVLIEKALDEHEMLTKEAEQEQKQPKNNNTISHSSSTTHIHSISQGEDHARRRSLSPDEAKRLALKEFEEARNYAAHHCQLRAECYQKAKDAIQRGNSGVAVYYSHIANLHKKKIDIYNHRAANCIMEVHDLTQNNPDFIDLHYLHVIEAIACLDIFIDKHIAKLRSIFRSFKYVFIITGRGLHSTGGVSTIKTRVKSRLKDRNLKWSEVNPGLLKVKIFSASKYSKNV